MQHGLENYRSTGYRNGFVFIWLAGLLLVCNVYANDLTDFGAITNDPGVQRPGKVVWMDLLTTDVPAATEFYTDVFGWQFDHSADGSYAYATLNGKPVAAIAEYDDDLKQAEGLWLASISVANVDAAIAIVEANGGRVIEHAENLPGRGRTALVEDPQGAVFMLLRSDSGDPEDGDAVNNDWLWTELWTVDVTAAIHFYEEVFSYRTFAFKGTAGSEFNVMGRDQAPRASVLKIQLEDVEPNWLGYLLVDDVDATARMVLKAGGKVLVAPQRDEFNTDVAIVADPTGGVFALQQQENK